MVKRFFTLVEVLAVIAIMSTSVAFVPVMFRMKKHVEFVLTCRKVRALLDQVKLCSLVLGGYIDFSIKKLDQEYVLQIDPRVEQGSPLSCSGSFPLSGVEQVVLVRDKRKQVVEDCTFSFPVIFHSQNVYDVFVLKNSYSRVEFRLVP